MIKKKGIMWLLFLSLAVSIVLTGCSSETSTNKDKDNGDKLKEKQFELTYWSSPDGLDEYEQSIVDEYNEKYPEHPIKLVTQPEGEGGELMAAMMSGTAPDVLILSYGEIEKFAYAGALRPMDEFFDGWDDYKNINHDMVEKFNFNGNRYSLPAGEYAMGFFYNKKNFEEAGITPQTEWSWDDLIATSEKLVDKETGQYGFALNWGQWADWWFGMFVWGAGGDLTKAGPNGELIPTFTDPAVIEAAQLYRDLKASGSIQTDMSHKLDELQQDFASGKASIIYHGIDDIKKFVQLGMNPNDFGVLPIPIGPAGVNPTQVGGSAYVIHAKVPEEKIDALTKYYELASSKEFYEGKIQYYQDQGFSLTNTLPRTDIDTDKFFGDTADDILAAIQGSTSNGKLSCYGSSVVASFVDQAVQKMFVETDQSIEEIFEDAQKEALKQAIPDYNKSIEN
ncbi:extracellular solute-binding protein [Pseudogracilibacillus auburnensis]|uniref:extracellular solute-binding protein n=1 Tax=Pseudogracilibacillus auburnensis TaxID=1494959 RepID=UPI001A9572E4|nr:extracellular solute-binding protein [Pseudogracilibacillus auburnensis]MBO1004766.1 extracellular solute-binding protein [Pseudogracilibacillus auburnensis]